MCHPHTSVVKVSKFGSEQFSFFFMPQRTLWKISECMLNSQSKVISHLTLYANNWLRFLYGPNPSTLSRQLLPPWARSYSSSTSCQEVGIVAYVSSSMSVHEGERGDGSKLLGKKTPREQRERELLLNSVFVCWLLTLQNQLTNWWGRGNVPISTTKGLNLFLDVLLLTQPSDYLCS